jgi:hypothetical protein
LNFPEPGKRPNFGELIGTFSSLENKKTFSVLFVVAKDVNLRIIVKLFDKITNEVKEVITKRKFVTTLESLDIISTRYKILIFFSFSRHFDVVCPLLTKDCFHDNKFVEAILIAYNAKRNIVLIHDISHPFPKKGEQPKELHEKNIFNKIALSLIKKCYDRLWRQLMAKLQREPNEIVRIF